jgi:sugar O-acyltransferase (sialic acid O-acetyltransferase NeuD family)
MAGHTPHDSERIITVGAGGFGREVLQWSRHAWPEQVSKIAGVLSADPDKLNGHASTLPILGSPADFGRQPSDGVVLAIGIQRIRRQVAEQLEANDARFLTVIHPTAIVADTPQIGAGTGICPDAIVSDAVRLGGFVLVNYYSSLGHDASAGDFTVLSPYATLGGAARLAEDAFLGLHASVAPGRPVGRRRPVSVNSAVIYDTGDEALVYGVLGQICPEDHLGP